MSVIQSLPAVGWTRGPASRRALLIKWSIGMFPWLLSAFFGSLSLLLLIQQRNGGLAEPYGTYESGFNTDIIPPKRIPLEQKRFGGSPTFLANGTGVMRPVDETAPWPENMVLFGEPSPEIDANWRRYIGHRYFSVSEDEAVRAWGDKRFEYVDEYIGGYTAGLDLFHTLHCVNAVRKALHPDYYQMKHSHGPFHVEHCLDAIRQAVQCYGSTTLIPTKYWDGLQRNYIESDQVHTCRSFQHLRDFVDSRRKGHEGYAERDLTLVDERKHEIAKAWKVAKNRKPSHGQHGH